MARGASPRSGGRQFEPAFAWRHRPHYRPPGRRTARPLRHRPADGEPGALQPVHQYSRLDVNWDGTASLAADWTIVPRDEQRSELHDRTAFALTGPVKTYADIVALTNAMLDELAARIERDMRPELPQRG
jgi:hypothetical protein